MSVAFGVGRVWSAVAAAVRALMTDSGFVFGARGGSFANLACS